MTNFEREFSDLLDAVNGDARACSVFVYTELCFHRIAGTDPDLRDTVNEHASFWNVVLGALQASGFVALGRLYDDDIGNRCVGRLLKFAEDYPGIFSLNALAARKVANGMSSTEAHTYCSNAHRFARTDLGDWRAQYELTRATYRSTVQPIRHRVFAHAGKLTRAERDALFTNVFLRDLERMAVFPLVLCEALWQLFHNGRKPILDLAQVPIEAGAVLRVTSSLKSTSTWDHVHAADSTARFMRSLGSE